MYQWTRSRLLWQLPFLPPDPGDRVVEHTFDEVAWAQAVADLALTPKQRRAALALLARVGGAARVQFDPCPSHAQLAGAAGVGVRTVQRALVLLREYGLIRWVQRREVQGDQRRQTTNCYQLMLPGPGAREILLGTWSGHLADPSVPQSLELFDSQVRTALAAMNARQAPLSGIRADQNALPRLSPACHNRCFHVAPDLSCRTFVPTGAEHDLVPDHAELHLVAQSAVAADQAIARQRVHPLSPAALPRDVLDPSGDAVSSALAHGCCRGRTPLATRR